MDRVMSSEKHTISFKLFYEGEKYQVQTYRGQYYSLMNLISDHLGITEFGLCCGMGSCGTCMVKIDGVQCLSCEVSVNEELADTNILLD